MGIRLRQEGIEDFEIFERGETVGGVWRANTYPGAACDVPSHLYSFSFAPGHNWSRRYAPQPEILDYMEEITDRFGMRSHLRLGTEVTAAAFDEASAKWTVTLDGGETREFDVLVTACGQLTRPQVPAVEGIEDFRGAVFHSAEWDHSRDLAGRKVAVIGTGASAIQFVPEVAKEAAELTIYQRSAPWVLPKTDRAYPAWERRIFERFPARVAAARAGFFAFFEAGTYGFTGTRWVLGPFRKVANAYRASELGDHPELLARATPDYEIGCKRVLFTSDWYSTLRRENVELLNGAVQRATPDGVVGADGKERAADTIIWGTGFDASRFVSPMDVHGLNGRSLDESLGGLARSLPRHHRRGLSEHVPALWAEHQPRVGLGPVHARVPVQLRDRRGQADAIPGHSLDRPQAGGPGALAGGDRPALRRHRLDHGRLHFLVHERRGPQHEQLGRPLARVPAPHATDQPGRLPGGRLMAGRGTAVVTGSSTGIGRACAVALDRAGFHVLAGVRKDADGESLRAAAPGLEPVNVDVTDAATIEALRAKVDAEHGGHLAALVNNAGISVAGPLEGVPLDEWRRQFEVNVIGQVAVTKALLPALRSAKGRVAFMSSVAEGTRSASWARTAPRSTRSRRSATPCARRWSPSA